MNVLEQNRILWRTLKKLVDIHTDRHACASAYNAAFDEARKVIEEPQPMLQSIGEVLDLYLQYKPDLTVMQLLQEIEAARHKITEAFLEVGGRP